jgi:hypothetical protein
MNCRVLLVVPSNIDDIEETFTVCRYHDRDVADIVASSLEPYITLNVVGDPP